MKRFFICILLVLWSFDCLYSQNNDADTIVSNKENRPKIGLVLSGGGAKGLAHIGVLKSLEENGIPIDYVAGTSMGAIVGGLYAAGYSPDEIEQIFYSSNFEDWTARKIDDKYRYYYQIADKSAAMFKAALHVDKKFKADLPMSLVNPVQMDYAFMQFFATANEVCKGDYNNLMLPFFCIASDISSKKQSVQRSGNIAKSIRASMTLPFFFSPMVIDGKMMCDGGVYNNFPSYEMDEYFSPDIVIWVKVVDNFSEPNEDDLVLYIENMVSENSKYEIPTEKSVMIEPNMKFISIMDFSDKQRCINQGYLTAQNYIKDIRAFTDYKMPKEEFDKRRSDFNARKKDLKIGNVAIHGANPYATRHIEDLLLMNMKGKELTLDKLRSNYMNIAAMPSIKSIEPTAYYNSFLDSYVLDLNVKTKNILQASVGGMLSTDPISNLYVGLEYNLFHRYNYTIRSNNYMGRYYSSANLSYRMDFPSKVLPFYIDAQINYNRWNYFRNRSGLFEYSANNYIIQYENNAQLRIGIPIGRRGKLVFKSGVGDTKSEYFNNDYILSTDTNDVTKFQNVDLEMFAEFNTLDDQFFPTKGGFINFNVQYVTGKEKFNPGNTYFSDRTSISDDDVFTKNHSWFQFSLQTKIFHDIRDNYAFGIITKSFYSFQDLFSTRKSSLMSAGSFAPTLETYTVFYPEYRANQFFAFGTEQIWRIEKSFLGKSSLRFGLYGFLPIREILANDKNQPYYGDFFQKMYIISALNFVVSTPIGNISLALSYTQRENANNSPWNLSLSFGTIVFNNKNIDR